MTLARDHAARPTGAVIIQADAVSKAFTSPDGQALLVLDGISFTLSEGEIVALLGKSDRKSVV